ncbi:hypothetical protein SFRURICE_000296 [Spodoptera frugiperda]|nr:hypothetical protein SFRURICE_000296 [Spodoptera frugiperda]
MFYNIHAKIIGEVKRSELFNSSYHKDGVYDEVEEIYVQFKSIDVSSWDLIIVHIVTSKLDRDTRKAWELQVASDSRDDLPTFDQLNEFLVGGSVPADNKPLVSCLSTGDKQTVLLTTALLKAESRHGKYQAVRALLDQGSQGSFISESMVQSLGLRKIPLKNVVYGLGGDKGATSTEKVVVRIGSRINPNLKLRFLCFLQKV